jgi:cytochrome c oxidase cbb3-type subunit 4
MDAITLQIIGTVISFITFISILAWAYSRRRARAFEDASRLPFEQD